MKLPNGDRAVIDAKKLTGYSLDPEHDDGRHKAHLFERLLGLDVGNVDLLLGALEQAALTGEAVASKLDKYGQRYVIDFEFIGPGGTSTIRSAWIVRRGEDFARLVTCFII